MNILQYNDLYQDFLHRRNPDKGEFNKFIKDCKNKIRIEFLIRNKRRDLAKNESIIEDVLGDILCIMAEKIDSYDPNRKPFMAWVHGITRFTCLNYANRYYSFEKINSQKQPSLEEPDIFKNLITPTGNGLNPEEVIKVKQSEEIIKDVLEQLPNKQYSVLKMICYDELTTKEIAQKLNTTTDNVYRLTHKARLNMKKKLESKLHLI